MSVLGRGPLRITSAASTRESGEKAIVPSTNGAILLIVCCEVTGGAASRTLLLWCVRPSRMSTDPFHATAKRVPSGLNLTAEIPPAGSV